MKVTLTIALVLLAALLFSPNFQVVQQAVINTPAPSGPSFTPGWTYVQDASFVSGCTVGSATCTTTACSGSVSQCMLPTTAGTVWAIAALAGNNVTISSVSGGGGTWSLCPSSECHTYNSTLGWGTDIAYNLSGSSATTAITVTMSANTTGYFTLQFVELKPPPGSTASFDTGAATNNSTCSTCTAADIVTSATDAVWQWQNVNGAPTGWTAWSSPYITDNAANGLCLNCSVSSAPTVAQTSTGGTFSAIAFKSSAGTFSPTTTFSAYNHVTPQLATSLASCSPACPAISLGTNTAAGDLGFIMQADLNHQTTAHISSVSGGGTWQTSSNCNIGGDIGSSSYPSEISCAWNTNLTGGVSSITPTMSASISATALSYWEIARSSGSFSSCTAASTSNTGGGAEQNGQALTLGSGPYVIFQGILAFNGIGPMQLYPLSYNGSTAFYSAITYSTNGQFASNPILLNTENGAAPLFGYAGSTTIPTFVFGLACQ